MPVTHEDILHWLQRSAQVLHENSAFLTELDSAIGDADHGINMDRGFTAVSTKIAGVSDADIGALLKTVGSTLVSTVGGASGPLYGTAFLRAGMATSGKQVLETPELIAMFDAALEGIKARGKAQAGEKTMLDAFIPAVDAAQQAAKDQLPVPQLLQSMAAAAEVGMNATIEMIATKGRASYLGERSVGHQDPGATSCWLILQALSDTVSPEIPHEE
ncbi:dihydroxyacetone kinase subunit DhaL [Dictyobacter kobayashii]|uniref:Dihydroxyacetone kinase subunit L n=1 Tax=Dictyobacter kobayashii TaxID=2014872 RepID=A0A402ALJ2_9CHLR|nr:dihydroxyacetone kinase subunit DhaL [Dictyobacter kobayashii]GCE19996.1 dihydroxyacetone kinase subunit L [Dictyobacter kobayashii]